MGRQQRKAQRANARSDRARRRLKQLEPYTFQWWDEIMAEPTRKDPETCEHFNRMEDTRATNGRSVAVTVQCSDCGLVLARHTRMSGQAGVRYFNAFGEEQSKPRHELPTALEVAHKKSQEALKKKQAKPYFPPYEDIFHKTPRYISFDEMMEPKGGDDHSGTIKSGAITSSAMKDAIRWQEEAGRRMLLRDEEMRRQAFGTPPKEVLQPVMDALLAMWHMWKDAESNGHYDLAGLCNDLLHATLKQQGMEMEMQEGQREPTFYPKGQRREVRQEIVKEALEEARQKIQDVLAFAMEQSVLMAEGKLRVTPEQERDYNRATKRITDAQTYRNAGSDKLELQALREVIEVMARWMELWQKGMQDRDEQERKKQQDDRFMKAFLAEWDKLPESAREISERRAGELLTAA